MGDGGQPIGQVASSKPRRRFIRFPRTFTLRVLLLLVFVAAIGFAALAWQINIFREQEAAAKSLSDRREGWVSFAWQPAQPLWFWRRIQQWTGARCEYVIAVKISSGRCDMQDATSWRKMPRLRCLLIRTGVTGDDVVDQIAELSHLESLRLDSAPMALGPDDLPPAPSNQGVRRFVQLKHLKQLRIQTGMVRKPDGTFNFLLLDDAGLLPITSQLPLESLDLGAAGVTINAVRPLLQRGTIVEFRGPRHFVEHVDELLACPTLKMICIDRLPAEIRKKAPDRLCDFNECSGISFGKYDFRDLEPNPQ